MSERYPYYVRRLEVDARTHDPVPATVGAWKQVFADYSTAKKFVDGAMRYDAPTSTRSLVAYDVQGGRYDMLHRFARMKDGTVRRVLKQKGA